MNRVKIRPVRDDNGLFKAGVTHGRKQVLANEVADLERRLKLTRHTLETLEMEKQDREVEVQRLHERVRAYERVQRSGGFQARALAYAHAILLEALDRDFNLFRESEDERYRTSFYIQGVVDELAKELELVEFELAREDEKEGSYDRYR